MSNAEKLGTWLVDVTLDILRTLSDGNLEPLSQGSVARYLDKLPHSVVDSLDVSDIFDIVLEFIANPSNSDKVRQLFDSVLNNPQAKELSEVMGAAVIGPFLSVMEQYADDSYGNPEDFAAAFHGLNIMITLPQFMANALQGSAVGTIFGRIGPAFQSVYWNLGLGFLGWQTLAPFLSSGLQPRLERHYLARFMPKRFDLSTLIYLYNTHELTAAQLLDGSKTLGWRAGDVQTLLNQSYKTLTDSEIKSFYNAGILTMDDVKDELARQGTNPRYITQTIKDILQKESDKDKSPTITQARKSLKLNLRSEADFRQMLGLLGYNNDAIDLEVAIIRAEQQDDNRELTNSQIREAYVQGILGVPEVTNALVVEGYSQADVSILLATWDAAKKPEVLKLNQTTIKQALINGVINAAKALALLKSIGYTQTDAQLIIDTILAGLNLARPRASISILITALSLKIINEQEFTSEAEARGYNNTDIRVFVGIANRSESAALGINEIQQAYIYRAIDETTALRLLTDLGSNESDAQLRIDTWKNQRENLRQRPSIGQWITFYRQELISDDQLTRNLENLGLSPEESLLLLRSANLAFPRSLSSGEIQQTFITGVITNDRAIALLKETGLSQENAQSLVDAWRVVIGYNTPTASINHLIVAYQDEIISQEEYVQALRDKGYPPDTIDFYVKLAEGPAIEVTRELTKSDIQGLYGDELIDYTDALNRLINLGYSPDDAELLLSRKKTPIEKSREYALFRQGYINPADFVDILISLGYTLDEINEFLDGLGV